MDQFKTLVNNRRSVRGYKSAEVEQEKLDYVVECARLAPSACNKQPWRFVAVTDNTLRQQICVKGLGNPVPNKWADSAPVIFVLCVATSPLPHTVGRLVKSIDYRLIDAGIAGEHLCLAAEEKGLGTCWIGWFKSKPIKKILGIPRGLKIVSLITMGYPLQSDEIADKRRLRKDEIFCMNGYSL